MNGKWTMSRETLEISWGILIAMRPINSLELSLKIIRGWERVKKCGSDYLFGGIFPPMSSLYIWSLFFGITDEALYIHIAIIADCYKAKIHNFLLFKKKKLSNAYTLNFLASLLIPDKNLLISKMYFWYGAIFQIISKIKNRCHSRGKKTLLSRCHECKL